MKRLTLEQAVIEVKAAQTQTEIEAVFMRCTKEIMKNACHELFFGIDIFRDLKKAELIKALAVKIMNYRNSFRKLSVSQKKSVLNSYEATEYLYELCIDTELQEIARKDGPREELIKVIHENFKREKQLRWEQEDYALGQENGKAYLSGEKLPSYDQLEKFSLLKLQTIAKVMNIDDYNSKTINEIIMLILAKSKELERARCKKYPLNYEQAVTHINKLLGKKGRYYRDGVTGGYVGVGAVWYIMMDCDNVGINDLFKYITGRDFVSFPRADFYSYNERKEIADCAKYIAEKIMVSIIRNGDDTRTCSEAGKFWYENYHRLPYKEKIA